MSSSASALAAVLASFKLASSSPSAVHDLVCDFVTAQAEAENGESGGWAGYRDVFLSAEVQDLISSRLPHNPPHNGPSSPPPEGGAAAVAGDGSGGSKKRKRKLEAAPAPAPIVDVSWTVCCVDGTTFPVEVPENTRLAEVKRAIGTLRGVPHCAFDLFVKGEEEPLDDERRLVSAGKVPLFMLPKQITDRLALEALFKSAGGTGWTNTKGWMTNVDLQYWHGVRVNTAGRVVHLDLDTNNLVGELPAEIGALDCLEVLDLRDNKLSGSIPAELGQLSALRCLALLRNELSGAIPAEIGQLAALRTLFLFSNLLSGAIPAQIGQLTALAVLDLSWNPLTGAIPEEIRQLPALARIRLMGTHLSGQEAFRQYIQEHNPGCDITQLS
jgi:hypothetical protein